MQISERLTVMQEVYCPECGYETDRDIASGQVIRHRGLTTVGHIVEAC